MAAYISELSAAYYPWRWCLAFDYDPAMVAAIKRGIPSRQRRWVPERKEWWFRDEVRTSMLLLAERYCGSVYHVDDVEGEHPTQGAIPAEVEAAYRAMHLLPTAPDEVVRAVYRVLCKLHHPDVGGTTAAMQAINTAYGTLAKRKG